MIWRWLICFSFVLVLSVTLVLGATVCAEIDVTGTHGSKHINGGNSPVVVWLEPLSGHVSGKSVSHAQMIQRNKHFLPHILPIEVGTIVDFPNFDPIFHNAFSSFDGQIFDIGLYPPGSTRSVSFRRKGIVRVFCNIHSTMSAVILVLDTPYFVMSKANGHVTLPNVPPGEYMLRVFDERATPETLAALSKPITVVASGLNLAPISVSEAGYLPLEHKNKYGLDYPPVPPEYLGQP